MPIATKELTKTNRQADGKWRVREVHADDLGSQWTFQYLIDSVANATAIMNGRDLSEQLIDRDISDVVSWVEGGNAPNTFDFTGRDITALEAEEEVAKHFARSPGPIALKVAWWIESLNPPSWNAIAGRLGWSTAAGEIGDRVQVRAQTMVVAEPDFNRVEDV